MSPSTYCYNLIIHQKKTASQNLLSSRLWYMLRELLKRGRRHSDFLSLDDYQSGQLRQQRPDRLLLLS